MKRYAQFYDQLKGIEDELYDVSYNLMDLNDFILSIRDDLDLEMFSEYYYFKNVLLKGEAHYV